MTPRRRGLQFAIFGLGRLGSALAETLFKMGCEVLAVDNDDQRVQTVSQVVTHAVQADATDEDALRSLGLGNFDVAVVTLRDLEAGLLITLILKELQVPHVVARATSELQGEVLRRVGADRIIFPERDMGVRFAHNLVSGNMVDYLELAPGFRIVEAVAPGAFIGKSLRKLDLRAKYGISVLAIKRRERIEAPPGPDEPIEDNDILIAMGRDEQLEKLEDDVPFRRPDWQ